MTKHIGPGHRRCHIGPGRYENLQRTMAILLRTAPNHYSATAECLLLRGPSAKKNVFIIFLK